MRGCTAPRRRAKPGSRRRLSAPRLSSGSCRTAALSRPDLFALLAEGLAAKATVVTPNRRLAQALAREFDAAQADKGLAVWESADILPLSALVERLYQDALYSDLSPALPLLLSQAQESELWEQVIRASPAGGELLDPSRAAAQAMHAWRLAHGWRIAGALGAFPGNEDAQAFARWAAAYARHDSTEAARLPDVVAPLLANAALRKPRAAGGLRLRPDRAAGAGVPRGLRRAGHRTEGLRPGKKSLPRQDASYSSPRATSSRRRPNGRGRRSKAARSGSAWWCPSSRRGAGKRCACSRAR